MALYTSFVGLCFLRASSMGLIRRLQLQLTPLKVAIDEQTACLFEARWLPSVPQSTANPQDRCKGALCLAACRALTTGAIAQLSEKPEG